MYNNEQRQRLREVLDAVSDDKEKRELLELDLAYTVDDLKKMKADLGTTGNQELKQAISETQQIIKKTRENLLSFDEKMSDSYAELIKTLGDKIDTLGGNLTKSVNNMRPEGAAPVFKDMVNQLSELNGSFKNWKYPQYSAVSVRDKNFANIDPSVAYQDASTTVAAPYGTLPAFDNAGTIARVTNLVGLPVNVVTGSISISSPGLSGLKVDLSKLTVATSSFSGIKVISSVTIASTSLSGLQVNLVKATTSALAGTKVFIENTPSVTLVSTSLSGLKTNLVQIAGTAVGTVSAGIQKVGISDGTTTLPVAVEGSAYKTSGPQLMVQANTGVPAGVSTGQAVSMLGDQYGRAKVLVQSVSFVTDGTELTTANGLKVVIATNVSTGLQVNLTKVTTSALSGTQVVFNGAKSNVPVNLSAATTSTLAGVKINVAQWNGTAPTTATALADTFSNPTPPPVGAFLMAWNGVTWDRLNASLPNADGINTGAVSSRGIITRAFAYAYNGTTFDRVPNGNGTSTGAMRVAVASDNSAFITTASLAGLKVLDRGIAVNAEQTATTNGLATPMITDLVGKLINLPYANPENFINSGSKFTATASSTIIAGIGSTRLYITTLIVTNSSATNTFVTLQDGSGGARLAVLPAPANSGAIVTLPVPIKTTAGNGLFGKFNNAVTTAFVTGIGYKGI